MALWDIKIDDVPFVSSNVNVSWAVDTFEGAHVVPVRKDFVSKSPLSPGARALLGPYDTFTFSLGGWVQTQTESGAETALAQMLGFFGSEDGKPAMFAWDGEPVPGQDWDSGWRRAEIRVLASTITKTGPTSYRFKIALENLWGAWYSAWYDLGDAEGPINGSGVKIHSGTWPTYFAEVDVFGPVTNPTLHCGDAPAIRYNGTIASGQWLTWKSFPPRATDTNGSVLADCSYTARWGYLFNLTPYAPGKVNWDKVKVTGSGTNSDSTFRVRYRALRV